MDEQYEKAAETAKAIVNLRTRYSVALTQYVETDRLYQLQFLKDQINALKYEVQGRTVRLAAYSLNKDESLSSPAVRKQRKLKLIKGYENALTWFEPPTVPPCSPEQQDRIEIQIEFLTSEIASLKIECNN